MRISVLGPTQVAGDTSLSRRDRIVLGALVVHGREPITLEQLADALWGEDVPKSSTKVVQGSVMRLRRVIGPDSIATTPSGYQFLLDGDTVDTHEFERLVERARGYATVHEPERAGAAYEQALRLWRGQPYPELQDWDPARAESARLVEMRRSVEEELVEARMQSGRTAEAVADARHLVAREPFREHRWALLALALYRSGRQREALDSIRRARTTLLDELGLDPGPELAELEQRILQQDHELLEVPDAPAAASASCPWPGLRPFDADQAELFAGREHVVSAALERLAEFPLLVVVGASGSGKSSLVRAGLVPELQRQGESVVILAPGASPVASLTTSLGSGPAQVLVVDQLEELFSSQAATEVTPFLSRLTSRVENGERVVVTLRADYLTELSASPAFARLAERGLLLLTPMSEDDLRRAIEEPARRSGLVLEPGLVDLLVRDVLGEAGGLPLMSHALAETWARRDGSVLTVEGYTRTGGIRGAVAQSAERLYDSLSVDDRVALRSVLHRLVTPTAGEPVAARVPTRVFAGTTDAPRLLDLLVRARLVTTSADTATIAHESLVRAWPRLRTWLDEDVEGQRTLQHLQVAADGWDSAARPDDELYRGARLQTAVEWRERTAPVLSDAEVDFLTASTFHEKDEELRRAVELDHQKKRNRQLRYSLGGVAGLLVLSLVAGSLAVVRGRQAQDSAVALQDSVASAERFAQQADAARLAAASRSEDQTTLALLMANQAVALADEPVRQADLLSALARADYVSSTIATATPNHRMGDTASPDGGRVLLSDWAVGVRLADTATGELVGSGPLEPGNADNYGLISNGAGFYDGGAKVAVMRDAHGSRGYDREIVRFDAANARPLGPAEPVPGSVSGDFFRQDLLHISPDGRTLLSFLDRRARVWRWDGRVWHGPTFVDLPPFPPAIPGQDFLEHVTFSNDGRFATMSLDFQGPPTWATMTSIAMDLTTMRGVSPWLLGGTNAAVSPDGRRWAVASLGNWFEVRSTDSRVRGVERVPTERAASVMSFGWSTDSRRLAVGVQEGSVSVYDVSPLRALAKFPADGSSCFIVVLPDHGRVLSVQADGRITVRSVQGTNAVQVVTSTPRVSAVAAGPTGTVVAGGLDNGEVAVLDQRTGTLERPLSLGPFPEKDTTFQPKAHRRVTALAVTPDGTAVVAGNRAGHLRMWRLSDHSVLWSTTVGPVEQLAVSPDGRFLATVESQTDSADPASRAPDWFPAKTTFRLWDLTSHSLLLSSPVLHDDGSAAKAKMLHFSPDSSMVAVPYMGDFVQVYRTSDPKKILEITPDDMGGQRGAIALTFTPDSSTLLVRDLGGNAIRQFDARTGRSTGPDYTSPGAGFGEIAFSPDGRWLFSRTDRGLSAFDVASRRLLLDQLPLGTNGGEGSMAITSDGYLYAATETGLLRLDIDPSRWSSIACHLAGRTLTFDEWSQLLPGRPYAPACTPPTS